MPLKKLEPVVLAVALLLPTVVTLAYFTLSASAPAAVQQTVYAVGKAVQFALPVVWILGVLRHRPQLTWGDSGNLWLGGLFGLVVAVAGWFGFYWMSQWEVFHTALEPIQQKVVDLGIDTPAKFLAVGAFYAVAHSFLEEYYWRWFVYGRLREVVHQRTAMVVSAAGFMLHHVLLVGTFFSHSPLAVMLLSIAVFVGGLVWAWLYQRSGSLAGPWLGHLLVDAGIFAIGYQMAF